MLLRGLGIVVKVGDKICFRCLFLQIYQHKLWDRSTFQMFIIHFQDKKKIRKFHGIYRATLSFL